MPDFVIGTHELFVPTATAARLGVRTPKYLLVLPAVSAELLSVIGPYISLAEKMGLFQGQVFGHDLRAVEIDYSGEVAEHDVQPVTHAVLAGLLTMGLPRRPSSIDRLLAIYVALTALSLFFAARLGQTRPTRPW